MDSSMFASHWDKITRNYHNRFKGMEQKHKDGLADDYYDALKDFPDGVVFLAVKGQVEGEKAHMFQYIGQLVNLCRGQAGVEEGRSRKFKVDDLPPDASNYDKEIHAVELQWKDRWVRLRIKELVLGVVGVPYGEDRNDPMSKEEATRKALKQWEVEKHEMKPGPPPPEVRAILDNFTKGMTHDGDTEEADSVHAGERNQGDRRLQRQADGRPSEDGVPEPDWAFEGPSCVPDWEQSVTEKTPPRVGDCPF